jgi:hypothetical protein
MVEKIQATLNPETVQRIAKIVDRPVTRGIDKMINQCLDQLEKKGNCSGNKIESESESNVE